MGKGAQRDYETSRRGTLQSEASGSTAGMSSSPAYHPFSFVNQPVGRRNTWAGQTALSVPKSTVHGRTAIPEASTIPAFSGSRPPSSKASIPPIATTTSPHGESTQSRHSSSGTQTDAMKTYSKQKQLYDRVPLAHTSKGI